MNILKVIASLTLLSTSIGAAHAIPADSLYKMSVNKPGSLTPFYQAHSKVPFTKPFDSLNKEQQTIVKSKFKSLGVNDTPPYPTEGSLSLYRPLLKAGAMASLTGKLKVSATIGIDGQVSAVDVIKSPNDYLSKKVVRIVSNTKFDAASCDGDRCEMNFPIEIQFN